MKNRLIEALRQVREVMLVIDGLVLPVKLDDLVRRVEHEDNHRSNVFQVTARTTSIQFNNQHNTLRTSVGLNYIHILMQNRDTWLHVSELVARLQGEPVDVHSREQLGQDDYGLMISSRTSHPVDILSREDITRFEKIMAASEKEALEYRKAGDVASAEESEERVIGIKDYLAGNTYRGRSATFVDAGDNNRKSVGNAISRAKRAIRAVNPHLAEHLKDSVHTGFRCCYKPKDDIKWDL